VNPTLIWKFAYKRRDGATKGEGRSAQKRYTQDARRPIQPDIAPFTSANMLDPVVLSLSIEDGTMEGREGAHLSYPIPYLSPYTIPPISTRIGSIHNDHRRRCYGRAQRGHTLCCALFLVSAMHRALRELDTCILARFIEDGAVEGRRGHEGGRSI
jgi:hypothetical protein